MPNGRVHHGLHLRHLLQEWLNLTMLVRDSFWLALQTACLSPSRNPLKMWREKKRDPQLTIAHDHPIAHLILPPWFLQHDSAWIGFLSTTHLPRIFLAVLFHDLHVCFRCWSLYILYCVYHILYVRLPFIDSIIIGLSHSKVWTVSGPRKQQIFGEDSTRFKRQVPYLIHISQLSVPDFQDHPLPQVRHMLLFECKLLLSSG